MEFKSKLDRGYLMIIVIGLAIIFASTLFPLIFIEEARKDVIAVALLLTICIFTSGMMLWMILDIKYKFEETFLIVKAGPIRKRIAYEDMTIVSPTNDILTGFRLLSSRDALVIYYRTGMMGEIKISPKDKEKFLKELQKRSPELNFKGF